MNIWKKTLGVALSGALMVGALAGCTSTKAPAADDVAGSTKAPAADDVTMKLADMARDTVLFTVDGEKVFAENYLYWLGYVTESVGYEQFGGADKIDWAAGKVGETPIKEYLTQSAMDTAKSYRIIETKAEEKDVTLSKENKTEIETEIAKMVEKLGGQEKYEEWLQQIGMSDAGFHKINEVSYLYQNMQEELFGEKGEKVPTDEDYIALAEEAGLMRAKHILLKTQDDAGVAFSAEEKAKVKTQAEGILAQLRAAEDPLKLFDEIMNEKSQDGRNEDGTLGAPDGYLFPTGKMMPAFEEGTKALKYDEISDLVETDYGYHIILRLAPITDEVRTAWPGVEMTKLKEKWMEEAKVETTEAYASIDPQVYYEKLSALRASLTPEPTPTPAPETSASPAPTAPPATTPAA